LSKEIKRKRLPASVSAAVYIEDDEGRLLLLRQASKRKGCKWGPPAGGMGAHENPIANAQRETKEEIGVDVKLIDLIGVYTVDRGDDATGIGFVFRGEILSDEMLAREREITDYKYFTPEEVRELIENNLIYKPEYNLSSFEDWLNGDSYPLEVIKMLV
jgi:8-oxo-dGTP pyrophosphatase MutT (NUDIX family)